jgi:hypothetical protein
MNVSSKVRELVMKTARQVQTAVGQKPEVFGQDDAATTAFILLFGPGPEAKGELAEVEPVDESERIEVLYCLSNANAVRNALNTKKASRSAELADKYQNLIG